MEEPFAQMGAQWQSQLNKEAVFTREIRFAKVDCATDRVLCNERGVEGFPHVQYYTGGALAKKWSGGRENDELRLQKWLQKRLDVLTSPAPAPNEGSGPAALAARVAQLLGALPGG